MQACLLHVATAVSRPRLLLLPHFGSGKKVKKLQGSIVSDCVLRTGGERAVAAAFQSVQVEKKRKAGRMSPIQNAMATGLTPSSSEKASLGTSVVEHIVLFKVKEDIVPEKKDEIFKSLRGLKKLDGVLHLTAEPVLSVQGAEFTHVLHGRYKDKAALAAYSSHPEHVSIVKNLVIPSTTDIMALDWESEPNGLLDAPFRIGRIMFVKVKEGVSEEETKALENSLDEFPSRFNGVVQVSAGPNFAPARAKGFNYGILALFSNRREADIVHSSDDHKAWHDKQLIPLVDSLIVVDFIPSRL
ncbi:unnamed protein product [Sphagnum troendelagicum]|uniref:Stress-response A/B barrel domain-containing protein n=1 Tax=Sphagnum troendelagicum TaxID=128251 RepID=A0ABP0TRQ6_9BRYO